jgi:hypothetical protein
MNYIVLTPDGVGSTILQRLLTIHLHMNKHDLINIHELTNGLKISHGVVVKDFNLGYTQSLDDIEKLLTGSKKEKSLVGRLAKYHMDKRNDDPKTQKIFYSFINNFFQHRIVCLRKNVFEYALSWSIRQKSGVKNIESKTDRQKVLQVDRVDEDYFLQKCKEYVSYMDWTDNLKPTETVYYEDLVTNTDSVLEKLSGVKSAFKETFGITLTDILKKEYESFNCLTKRTPLNINSREKNAVINYRKFVNDLNSQGIILSSPVKNTTLTDKKKQIQNFDKCLDKFRSFAKSHNWIDQSIATYDFYTGDSCVED